jgi:hypothetical protein
VESFGEAGQPLSERFAGVLAALIKAAGGKLTPEGDRQQHVAIIEELLQEELLPLVSLLEAIERYRLLEGLRSRALQDSEVQPEMGGGSVSEWLMNRLLSDERKALKTMARRMQAPDLDIRRARIKYLLKLKAESLGA